MSERRPRTDIPGTVRPTDRSGRSRSDQSELSRYDVLLVSIPIVMLCAVVVGLFAPIPLWASLSLGALLSVPMLVDGVALNPPT